jgi:hypothetical protein
MVRTGALVAACALLAAGAGTAGEEKQEKVKRPHLELRAAPRMAFSPVNVLLTLELVGGGDVEEYHCPEVEWDWDDGGKSVHEADCAPFEEGKTTIERRFTADHEYSKAGVYQIKATMRRLNRTLATATVKVTVRPGIGDPTIERFDDSDSLSAGMPRPPRAAPYAPAASGRP